MWQKHFPSAQQEIPQLRIIGLSGLVLCSGCTKHVGSAKIPQRWVIWDYGYFPYWHASDLPAQPQQEKDGVWWLCWLSLLQTKQKNLLIAVTIQLCWFRGLCCWGSSKPQNYLCHKISECVSRRSCVCRQTCPLLLQSWLPWFTVSGLF